MKSNIQEFASKKVQLKKNIVHTYIRYQSKVVINTVKYSIYLFFSEGKRHNASMLMSDLYHQLEMYSHDGNGNPLAIYGDPAYPHRVNQQSPYKGANLTDARKQFNQSMSAVRVCVEWPFEEIVKYFAFNDFKKNLKIGLQSVAKGYAVSCLLYNAKVCLQSSNTASYYGLKPPTIDEYFNQSM